ncbi:2,3-bisphosphoglycerate-independent phosphoglycerate mutase [Candidatus Pacearchaeota archaeon]|nr:2,3-bisphosphoglycerate-independent phosphoglycerate mutase [Candidatus Pacearchaeota archaeon]
MKGVFVIMDGVADEPCSALDGKTPLEAANTPNLDYFSGKGKIDYCYTVKEGIAPESSSAVVSLLGYDYRISPRGPLEASGFGLKLTKGDLALRCNFATVDDINDGNIMDRRAGRTLTTNEAMELARAVNEGVKLPFKFEFHATSGHRGVLVFRGGFSDNITNADPFYSNGMAVSGKSKVVFSKPLDDEEDSMLSAELVNNFIRQSHEILDKHPINVARVRKGLFSANFILCRDAGNSLPNFKKLKGKWMALGYMPLEKGIAKAAKMDLYSFKYPKMRGIDSYAHLYSGLYRSIKYALRMIKRNYRKYDYFYVHFKETDIPGHDNKPLDKVKMIEMIDKGFFGYLKWYLEKSNAKLVVTADHTTSCRMKGHSDKPVPVLTYPSEKAKGDRFTERDGMNGRKIMGRKLLQENMFGK